MALPLPWVVGKTSQASPILVAAFFVSSSFSLFQILPGGHLGHLKLIKSMSRSEGNVTFSSHLPKHGWRAKGCV